MKIKDAVKMQHTFPDDLIYLINQGSFYHVYNEGADHLHLFTGYKVRECHKYGRMAGFPCNVLAKVLINMIDYYPGYCILVEPVSNTHLVLKLEKRGD